MIEEKLFLNKRKSIKYFKMISSKLKYFRDFKRVEKLNLKI
jgi:hypothetical protein